MSNQYQYRKADKGLYGPVEHSRSRYLSDLAYNSYLLGLPRVASVPSCEWKDGEIVEEGKDFKHGYRYNNEKGEWVDCSFEVFITKHPVVREWVAVPISGGEVKEEETKLPERLKQLDSLNKGEEGTKPTDDFDKRLEYSANNISKLHSPILSEQVAYREGIICGAKSIAAREYWQSQQAAKYLAVSPNDSKLIEGWYKDADGNNFQLIKVATPSVDAGKETFSREDIERAFDAGSSSYCNCLRVFGDCNFDNVQHDNDKAEYLKSISVNK